MEIENTHTYSTRYGKITLYKNEAYIANEFKKGSYDDIKSLMELKQYIDPEKNILEIGGHCGTSSVIYSSFLKGNSKIYIYEPQKNLFKLLCRNIFQNNITNAVPNNKGVFCFNGKVKMNHIDIDGGRGIVEKRYTNEGDKPCNFGGIGIGGLGEEIEVVKIDDMGLDNVGYIHCDAQGSENYLFSTGQELIKRCRPVIYYENLGNTDAWYCKAMFNNVKSNYPQYSENSLFDIEKFCLGELGYTKVVKKLHGSLNDILIP